MLESAIPEHLFVGTIDGEPTCTPDANIYEIWPKFQVMLLLQGAQKFVIDDTLFHLDAGHGALRTPIVLLLNVARFSKLRFINDSTVPLRKTMISAPRPWIQNLMASQATSIPALRDFFSRHLANVRMTAGRHVIQLAEQIMAPPPGMSGEVLTLYRNSKALDIMCSCCLALAEQEGEKPRPHLMSQRQSERVREYILENLDKPLSIDSIAQEVGASVSSVQRHFKEHFGETVFEFVRGQRLAIAYETLQRDGVTIAQAAHAAGYAAASHFTTAFKRAYGVSPKHKRR